MRYAWLWASKDTVVMRLLLCSLLFGSFAALGLISCAERPDSLPSFARPDRVAGFEQIGSGTKPAGAGSTNPYWVFGGQSSFAALLTALSENLRKQGWHTLEDPKELIGSPGDESYCIAYADVASGSGYVRNTLEIIRLRNPSTLQRLKQFAAGVIVELSSCG